MKSTLLFLFSCLVLRIHAYGAAGQWERAWFWELYQQDTYGNSIAKSCRTKKGKCSFEDFIVHIEDPDNLPNLDRSKLRNIDTHDIDAVVKALGDGRFTGTYVCNRMIEGLGRDDVRGLFERLTAVQEYLSYSMSDDEKNRIKRMTTAILQIRQANEFSTIQQKMRDRKLQVRSSTVPFDYDSGQSFSKINVQQTAIANKWMMGDGTPDLDKCEGVIEDIRGNDEGHGGNISALEAAVDSITQSCALPK